MIDTRDATLDKTPESLNGVGVGIAIDVDFGTVVNPLVPIASLGEPIVAVELIGIDNGIPCNILGDKGNEGRPLDIGSYRGQNLRLSLCNTHYRNLAFRSTPSLAMPDSAEIGLIGLNFSDKDRGVLVKKRADLPEHPPCGFVSDASLPLDGHSRMSGACGSHFVDSIKPSLQGGRRLVEDCARERRNLMAAAVTLIDWATANLVILGHLLALWALNTLWPSVILEPFKTGIAVWKRPFKVSSSVLLKLPYPCFISGFHCLIPPYTTIITQKVHDVKG